MHATSHHITLFIYWSNPVEAPRDEIDRRLFQTCRTHHTARQATKNPSSPFKFSRGTTTLVEEVELIDGLVWRPVRRRLRKSNDRRGGALRPDRGFKFPGPCMVPPIASRFTIPSLMAYHPMGVLLYGVWAWKLPAH